MHKTLALWVMVLVMFLGLLVTAAHSHSRTPTLRQRTDAAVWQVCRNIRIAKHDTVAKFWKNVRKGCQA